MEIDPNSYTKKDGKTFVDGVTPSGDCMVGSDGDLYSVHDLKHELLECNPDRLTVTLDCCRSSRKRKSKEYIRLRYYPYM